MSKPAAAPSQALNDKKVEIRIQFKPVPALLFPHDDQTTRNELVMRIQPDEAVYMKMMVKKPGFSTDCTMTELDLSYSRRYAGLRIPDGMRGGWGSHWQRDS